MTITTTVNTKIVAYYYLEKVSYYLPITGHGQLRLLLYTAPSFDISEKRKLIITTLIFELPVMMYSASF